jgi:hypothetical protein
MVAPVAELHHPSEAVYPTWVLLVGLAVPVAIPRSGRDVALALIRLGLG